MCQGVSTFATAGLLNQCLFCLCGLFISPLVCGTLVMDTICELSMPCYKQRDMNTSIAISLFQRSNHPEISACSQAHLNARCTLLLRVGGPRFTTKLCRGFVRGKKYRTKKVKKLNLMNDRDDKKWCLLIFKFLGE